MPEAQRVNGLRLVGGQFVPEATATAEGEKKKKPKKHKGANPKAKALIAAIREAQAAPQLPQLVDFGRQLLEGAAEGWVNNLNRKKLLGAYAVLLRSFAAMAEG